MGAHPAALIGGPAQVIESAFPLLPALIVISQHGKKFGHPARVQLLDCTGHQVVQLFAAFREQTFVRHFLGQSMFEKAGVFREQASVVDQLQALELLE